MTQQKERPGEGCRAKQERNTASTNKDNNQSPDRLQVAHVEAMQFYAHGLAGADVLCLPDDATTAAVGRFLTRWGEFASVVRAEADNPREFDAALSSLLDAWNVLAPQLAAGHIQFYRLRGCR